ncbi:MAG: leucine-rich repeat domain-containing protein, partial [Promethearchaeota archaeon]
MDPTFIKDNLDQLGETEARKLLSEWIISSTDQASREDALNLFASIDNYKNFNFFEQLFLSDENHEIRVTAGKILTANYPNHDKLVPLLSFTLREECNIDLKFFAIESLFIIDSKRTRRIIFEYLDNFFRLNQSQITGQVLNNFLDLQDGDDTLSRDILEYCYNLILHDFYVNQCNFYVVMRDGFIILLNVENAGLSKISQIQGLTKLTHLEHFLLKNNHITTIEDIKFLRSLKILNLSSNNITEIRIPKTLMDLEELYLSSNRLKKIKNLQHLRNLRKLFLDH